MKNDNIHGADNSQSIEDVVQLLKIKASDNSDFDDAGSFDVADTTEAISHDELQDELKRLFLGVNASIDEGEEDVYRLDDDFLNEVNSVQTEVFEELEETEEHTGIWAWRHPHGDGTITYTLLRGDVRLTEVDFAYVPEK